MATPDFPHPASLNRLMVAETLALLDGLDHRHEREAVLHFDSPARFDWHYIPRDRPGLHLRDMNERQRRAVLAMLRLALSDTGFASARAIMELEEVLRAGGSGEYDHLNYAVAVFGNPHAGPPWAWRLDGHHLSLSFTVVDEDTITAVPHFMGADPATLDRHHLVHSVLGAEEKLGRALFAGLDESRRNRALIAETALDDIVTGPGREYALRRPVGLPFTALTGDERAALMELVGVYAHRLRPELAALELSRLAEAGPDCLHFAWAGEAEPGRPHYYRIHGPTLVIEYDNTQGGANHIHTVWHDPALDFGLDLLGEHYGTRH